MQGRVEISPILYADDTLFSVGLKKSQMDIPGVMLLNFEAAFGLKVNLFKTYCLFVPSKQGTRCIKFG